MNSNGINVEPVSHSGRTWTANAIEELIVGRKHGDHNFNQILLYITYNNVSLAGITVAELELFWNNVLMHDRSRIDYWENMHRGDPRLQGVLNRINTLLVQAQAVTP